MAPNVPRSHFGEDLLRFLIIGNGIAGNTAAGMIRHLDATSEITIVSDEKHSFYTACALPHYLAGDLKKRGLFVKTRPDYRKDRISLRFGCRVVSLHPKDKQVLLEGEQLDYDRLIIATGSRPFLPPIEGIKLPGVCTFKYLDDAVRIVHDLPRTAVIVGTGPIGIEAGIALRRRGVAVHMVELMDRIMPRIFDDRPASLLVDVLRAHGVEVLTGERVMRLLGTERVEGIMTDKRTIPCEMVIMAAGMRPNSELAREAGIGVATRGGIIVDKQMATTVPDVYACGDCVEAADMITGAPGMIQLWHNAKEQGGVAGSGAAGVPRSFAGSINITSLDIFDNHAVSFGNIYADLSQQEGVEVIETFHGVGVYHRLVLRHGQVVGAQFVGDSQDMGSVLYALIRKDRLSELREFGTGQPLVHTVQRHYGLSRLLASRKRSP
jgi:NADH oxidase (H2O2-forming)